MFDHVIAVPGEANIIDTVKPNGRTTIRNETLAEVQQRYPSAVLMEWEAWRAERAAAQDTPINWIACTERQYTEMLEVLPPIDWNGLGFLVGEPTDHSFATGQPRYQAYRKRGGGGPYEACYFASSRPLTRQEWRQCR